MGYKAKIVHLLDHPGGRFLLGTVATTVARRVSHQDIKISYVDGCWTCRTGAQSLHYGAAFPCASENIQEWRKQTQRYTPETRDHWLRFYEPEEGDTIIDVGAGHGEDTFTFSRLAGKTGRVIAIEAHPLSFKALENFCRLNHLENVTPVHLALMDKPGSVRIIESEHWMENRVASDGEPASSTTAPAGTLDDLCRKLGIEQISFLKMNIESAERHALLGAEETMPRVRHICVACHDFRADHGHGEQFRTRAFVERFLAEHRFQAQWRLDDQRDYIRDQISGLRDT